MSNFLRTKQNVINLKYIYIRFVVRSQNFLLACLGVCSHVLFNFAFSFVPGACVDQRYSKGEQVDWSYSQIDELYLLFPFLFFSSIFPHSLVFFPIILFDFFFLISPNSFHKSLSLPSSPLHTLISFFPLALISPFCIPSSLSIYHLYSLFFPHLYLPLSFLHSVASTSLLVRLPE